MFLRIIEIAQVEKQVKIWCYSCFFVFCDVQPTEALRHRIAGAQSEGGRTYIRKGVSLRFVLDTLKSCKSQLSVKPKQQRTLMGVYLWHRCAVSIHFAWASALFIQQTRAYARASECGTSSEI